MQSSIVYFYLFTHRLQQRRQCYYTCNDNDDGPLKHFVGLGSGVFEHVESLAHTYTHTHVRVCNR